MIRSSISDAVQINLNSLSAYTNPVLAQVNSLDINGPESDNLQIPSRILTQLAIIQKSFSQVYSLADPLKIHQVNLQNKDKTAESIVNIGSVSFAKITTILEPFQNGSIYESIVATEEYSNLSAKLKNEVDVIGRLEDLIIVYLTLILTLLVSDTLLGRTMPLYDDIEYYEDNLSSNYKISAIFCQSLPERTWSYARFLYDEVAKRVESYDELQVAIPTWLPPVVQPWYRQIAKWTFMILQTMKSSIKTIESPSVFLLNVASNSILSVGLPKKSFYYSTKDILRYTKIILEAPLLSLKEELYSKRKALVDLRKENAQKLGYLSTLTPQIPSLTVQLEDDELLDTQLRNLVKGSGESINHLLNIFLYGERNNEPSPLLQDLYSLSSKLLPDCDHNIREIKRLNGKPKFIIRYWIPLLLLVLYVPSTSMNILHNRRLIAKWIQTNLVDTVVGFWNNWILSPLNNILATVKHDDNSRIAITTQASLDADLDSLERMVIDYALEKSKLPPGTSLTTYRENLSEMVKKGDLTPIMRDYESELKSPFKGIVMGDLVRNLLIQIQKTKVDGATAMNGIDKLLKSQELVFGVVAASPSILIVYWLVGLINSYTRTGYLHKLNVSKRTEVLSSFNTIQRILNFDDSEPEPQNVIYERYGTLLMEILVLRKSGIYFIPTSRRQEWLRDIRELSAPSQSYSIKTKTVQRMLSTYGNYFK
ncbi:hypothetical protein LJB42_003215 [Komagataella kurtzmanii]|nr:hypothetical protein LJB42_003215 [Komagataella kurtzmanii]